MYKNDIKQTWTIIKDTLQNKAREELPNKYLLNDRTLTNMDEIANEFNKYFINIGRLLSEQIISGHSSDEYLNDKTELVFTFTPVTEDYIANVISNLKNKSSYGYDNISNKLIKLAKLPTRCSDTANTLIDNIFTTNNEINDISGILLNHISDHQMVFTYV